jgi:hypothetical protein
MYLSFYNILQKKRLLKENILADILVVPKQPCIMYDKEDIQEV